MKKNNIKTKTKNKNMEKLDQIHAKINKETFESNLNSYIGNVNLKKCNKINIKRQIKEHSLMHSSQKQYRGMSESQKPYQMDPP